LIKEKKPDVTVQIVGKGDAIPFYRQLATELSLDKNVTFITDRQGEQMVPVYQAAKIIVLPSKTEAESFGMVLAEAMACGVAAVGSRIGGIPNVIQHNETGILVPPNDGAALSKSILELLAQPERAHQLAHKGMLSIKEKFTLSKMTETNIDLLHTIAKKDIVHISAYYPPHLGGMELAIEMLTRKLYDKGYRISVITSAIGNETAHSSYISPFPVARLRAFVAVSTPIIPGLLWKLLRASPRSVFHVHVAQAGIPEVAFIAAKIRRIPLVLHVHGDVEASSAAGFLLPLYKKLFLGFVLRHAQAVIVPTPTYQKTMTKRYKLKNAVHAIPTGIDERYFLADYKKKSQKHFTVLYVGRLTVEKNVDLLIKAMQNVGHSVHFIIIGDGLLRRSLEKTARKNNTQDCIITFAGRKSSDELLAYYQKADVLVLASNYESQSLVVLEAMAAGTPVIVADVPAVNEIVGDAGILTAKTVDAFSAAITTLIENPNQRLALAQRGKQRAKAFSWSTLTNKFEDVYDTLEK
jgi:glycosyltransferase involved in cell wall biosynthesis